MRTAADYFGLMAYIWVMSGGMPGDDAAPPAERVESRRAPRGRGRLRVIEGAGGRAGRAKGARRSGPADDAGEAAA